MLIDLWGEEKNDQRKKRKEEQQAEEKGKNRRTTERSGKKKKKKKKTREPLEEMEEKKEKRKKTERKKKKHVCKRTRTINQIKYLLHRIRTIRFKIGNGRFNLLQAIQIIVQLSVGSFANERLRVSSHVIVTDHVLQNLQCFFDIFLPEFESR